MYWSHVHKVLNGTMGTPAELRVKFRQLFGTDCRIYRAPGRVNLIGEHTDYTDGFVLPAPLSFSCWIGIAPREDLRLALHSENFAETVEISLGELRPELSRSWAAYPLGVAWALREAGYTLRGANVYIRGEVPLGAGLSSSAAIEVAFGLALADVSRQVIDRTRLAVLCQKAENDVVGARCGIMDQFVSCHGRQGHALLLDCRSLEHQYIPLAAEIQWVLCNSMVKHDLAAGEYNVRRAECEEATRRLAAALPNVRALRDVSLAQLAMQRELLTATLFRRCHHIVSENGRVLGAVTALEIGYHSKFGELMGESHRSLRDDFEVSCEELDLLVDLAMQQKGIYGARMTGGGFGGCTVNLVNRMDAPEFKRQMEKSYLAATGRSPDIYLCEIGEGASLESA